MMLASTIMFMLAGSNWGFLNEYPKADIVQGVSYQTGYFVNGKHVDKKEGVL